MRYYCAFGSASNRLASMKFASPLITDTENRSLPTEVLKQKAPSFRDPGQGSS
jgi:hypothetical protein